MIVIGDKMVIWKKLKANCEMCGNSFMKGENTSRTTCSNTCSTQKWSLSNIDRRKEYDKDYSKRTAERRKEVTKEWTANNKEKKLSYDKEYQRKKRAAL